MRKADNLMNQEVLQEEYEESKIRLIMAEFAEIEGKRLLEENEELSKDPFYLPTAVEKQTFIVRLNVNYVKHRLMRMGSIAWPIHMNKIALLFVFVMVLFGMTFATVEAFRVKVLNFLVQMDKEYTVIRLDEDSPNAPGHPQKEWENAYEPSKIPENYQMTKITDSGNIKTIEYVSDNGGFIIFQQNHENTGIHVDTEDADEVMELTINGQKGLFVSKKDIMTIVWQGESYLFMLMGNSIDLNREKMIEIAESVTISQ